MSSNLRKDCSEEQQKVVGDPGYVRLQPAGLRYGKVNKGEFLSLTNMRSDNQLSRSHLVGATPRLVYSSDKILFERALLSHPCLPSHEEEINFTVEGRQEAQGKNFPKGRSLWARLRVEIHQAKEKGQPQQGKSLFNWLDNDEFHKQRKLGERGSKVREIY